MYVRLLREGGEEFDFYFDEKKKPGELIKCYRHEQNFADNGQVREEYFLVKIDSYDDDVYQTTEGQDYHKLVYHDPELPRDYSQGKYAWMTEADCELADINNQNMRHLLTPYEWSLN